MSFSYNFINGVGSFITSNFTVSNSIETNETESINGIKLVNISSISPASITSPSITVVPNTKYTLFITGNSTVYGSILFAKNSLGVSLGSGISRCLTIKRDSVETTSLHFETGPSDTSVTVGIRNSVTGRRVIIFLSRVEVTAYDSGYSKYTNNYILATNEFGGAARSLPAAATKSVKSTASATKSTASVARSTSAPKPKSVKSVRDATYQLRRRKGNTYAALMTIGLIPQ